VWQSQSYCAVYGSSTVQRVEEGLLDHSIRQWVEAARAVDPVFEYEQSTVLVGVIEPLEDDQNMVVRVPPTVLGCLIRLIPLDECLSIGRHPLDPMVERAAVGGISFEVFPCSWDAPPGVLSEDGVIDELVLHLRPVERDGHM